MITADFNIGDSILFLFPNAKPGKDFVVKVIDGQFELSEWNLPEPVPKVSELSSVYSQAQALKKVVPTETEQLIKRLEEAENAILMLMDLQMGGM